MNTPAAGWTIHDWRRAVTSGLLTEEAYLKWLSQFSEADPAWIHVASGNTVLEQLAALSHRIKTARASPEDLPLFGVPFAVKDNIDVAGMPTTAACPSYSYLAAVDATVVRRLKDAGAVVVGKTNLDQFATGLVGTRSPYGVVRSAFDSRYIGGGSSSGSASVVARGQVPFSLGTDTAGSGRVPAAFGNIVGFKPTRGLWSTKGVVPACRTLDCVSAFTLTVSDAKLLDSVVRHWDPEDPYSRVDPGELLALPRPRPSIGYLEPMEFFGDTLAKQAFAESRVRLAEAGWDFVPVDATPFLELAELLYGGTWVAERCLTVGRLLEDESLLDPAVSAILQPARELSAEDAFRCEYQRAHLARQIQESIRNLDALLVPTTGTTYRVTDVQQSPIETNARLGRYTNFTNLADLSAVAVPGQFRADGLPSGLTLLGTAFSDDRLFVLAKRAHSLMGLPVGATERSLADTRSAFDWELPTGQSSSGRRTNAKREGSVRVVVVGAHLSLMPLNGQLTERGGKLVRATKTSSRYRLFLLAGTTPPKPGLLRTSEVEAGAEIDVEVWELPLEGFGEFTSEVPPPLGIGNVELVDGSWEKGFICEPYALDAADEITNYGGFRAYMNQKMAPPQ